MVGNFAVAIQACLQENGRVRLAKGFSANVARTRIVLLAVSGAEEDAVWVRAWIMDVEELFLVLGR